MPFYRVLVRPGLLTAEQRQDFANDVVDVHCGVTGAPRSFVHVLFVEDDRLPEGRNGSILGTIRSGRNDEQKAEIASQLDAALSRRAGVDADTITTVSRDIEASFTMEGGALLPEPGSPEEAAWKAIGSPPTGAADGRRGTE